MTKKHGNPKFEIRVHKDRRVKWQQAADIEQRSLSDFVKVATDEKTERILRMAKKSDRFSEEEFTRLALELQATEPEEIRRFRISNWPRYREICAQVSEENAEKFSNLTRTNIREFFEWEKNRITELIKISIS